MSAIAGSASTTVHMYFGNPSADNASDGSATFLFFDDFEDGQLDGSKWGPLHACDAGVTVSETGIVAAMRHSWERMKVLVEPSSAVPLAALLEHRLAVAGTTIETGGFAW